jgi:hypothetical protein
VAGVEATTPQDPPKRHRENARHRRASAGDGGEEHADVPGRAPA